jgi:hypothetical protein
MCTIQKALHLLLLEFSHYPKIQPPNTVPNNRSEKAILPLRKMQILLQILLNKILLSLININQLLEIINLHRIMYLLHIYYLNHLLIDLLKQKYRYTKQPIYQSR